MSLNNFDRKAPVHYPSTSSNAKAQIVFLTVCTKNRQPVLACHQGHTLLREAWKVASSWLVGRYVLMPDHVHLFCAPESLESPSLDNWVRFWKSIVARSWPFQEDVPLWQQNYWDRDLRSGESYDEKWNYVFFNPVRHGLSTIPEEWPYAGEVHKLEW